MSRALSGSKRVLNDTVVNIHSACQSYKNLILKGITVLQTIQSEGGKVDSNFEKLGTIITEMDTLVRKLGIYSEQLCNLSELNKGSAVPFLTWDYKDFSDVAKELYESYQKETDIKVKIAHSIYSCTPDQLNFCIIAWTHLVYLINETKFEAFLHECGLK